MKKFSLLLLSFIILPCICLFSACDNEQPPKELVSISASYTGNTYAHYVATTTTPVTLEMQYGDKAFVDTTQFQVFLNFSDNTQLVVDSLDAMEDYGVMVTHNVPSTPSITPIGDYNITFTAPNDAKYDVVFRVVHRTIELPVVSNLSYTGTAQTPTYTLQAGDEEFVELVAVEQNAVNVGTYDITFKLKDKANCVWFPADDSATEDKTLEWEITPKLYKVPTAQAMTYTGDQQTVILTDFVDEAMTLSGVQNAVNVSATPYTTFITLKDTTNCAWADNTTNPKTVEWNLLPMQLTKPTLNTSVKLIYNGDVQYAPILNKHENINFTNASATDCRTYTCQVSLIDNTNYVWEDKTIAPFTIEWSIAPAVHDFEFTLDNTPLTAVYGTMRSEVDLSGLEALYPGVWTSYEHNTDTRPVGDVKDNGQNYMHFTYLDVSTNFTTSPISIPIIVTPIMVAQPTVVGATTFDYDGAEHNLTLANVDTDLMTVYNPTFINAGTYITNITLIDFQNYNWIGAEQNAQYVYFEWSINPLEVTVQNNDADHVFQIAQGTSITLASLGELPITITPDAQVNIDVTANANNTVTLKITLKCIDDYITAREAYENGPATDYGFEYAGAINYVYPDMTLNDLQTLTIDQLKALSFAPLTYEFEIVQS